MSIVLGFLMLVIGGVSIWLKIREQTIRLNGLRRPDGSYADYDFPGIFNGGKMVDLIVPNPNRDQAGTSQDQHEANVDLYGRPLSAEVIAQRNLELNAAANPDVQIRAFQEDAWEVVWKILEPVIRAGETYALARDMSQEEMHRYWIEMPQQTYVAYLNGQIVGTYFLKANQAGPGKHVSNCGFVVSDQCRGQGVAMTMGLHALAEAKRLGYRAMQFNFVVSTNEGAIRLWQRLGFAVVGRLPRAFEHPTRGYVDALVMYRSLLEVEA